MKARLPAASSQPKEATQPTTKTTADLSAFGKAALWWNRFWFKPTAGYSLAAFRIFFGIYLLCYFLRFLPHVTVMFSTEGVYVPYLVADLGLPRLVALLLFLFTLAVIGSFVLGYRARLVTPLLLLLYAYYYFLNFSMKNTAYDRLNLIFLGILCFAETDRVWAMSAKDPESPMVSVWPIRMLTIQVCLVYFGAGFWKLISPAWHEGEMLRWTFMGAWGTPFAFWLVQHQFPAAFFTALVFSVILFELGMPFALIARRTRTVAFIVGASFHLGNWLLLDIPEFMNCVATYVLFMEPEQVGVLGRRILGWGASKLTVLSRE